MYVGEGQMLLHGKRKSHDVMRESMSQSSESVEAGPCSRTELAVPAYCRLPLAHLKASLFAIGVFF
jgi:hypothetical protein